MVGSDMPEARLEVARESHDTEFFRDAIRDDDLSPEAERRESQEPRGVIVGDGVVGVRTGLTTRGGTVGAANPNMVGVPKSKTTPFLVRQSEVRLA